jgi:hypothetical protein
MEGVKRPQCVGEEEEGEEDGYRRTVKSVEQRDMRQTGSGEL